MQKPKEYWLILWEDPATDWDGWVDLEDMGVKALDMVFSVGFPAREDDTHVYVVMDWSKQKGNTVGKIPKHAIKAIKKIALRGFPPKEEKKDGKRNGETNL